MIFYPSFLTTMCRHILPSVDTLFSIAGGYFSRICTFALQENLLNLGSNFSEYVAFTKLHLTGCLTLLLHMSFDFTYCI